MKPTRWATLKITLAALFAALNPLPSLCLLADVASGARSATDTLRDQIAALADRAQAIVDLATADNGRELSAEERTEIDAILGVGVKGSKDYQAGQIDKLEQDLERLEKIEARQQQLAQARQGHNLPFARGTGPQRGPDQPDENQPRASRIVIPQAANFQHGRLVAYTGPHARQEAYIAGQFFLATLWNHEPAKQWCAQHGIDTRVNAALGGGTNSLGGVLIPSEMEQSIILLREEYGVFRRNAEIAPMAGDTKDHPISTADISATFSGENQTVSESDPTWGNAKLVAKKIGAIVRYSNELNEDSIISLGDNLTAQFARAFAKKEDQCGYNGDGTSTYGGIVGLANALAAGSIHTAASGNTTFATLDLEDFHPVVGMLPEYAGSDPKWHISKAGFANAMQRLAAAAGGNTMETLANGMRQRMFLGYPVEIVQVMPQALTGTTSTILAYFGDLRQAAVVGNRRGISIMLSDQRYFEYDQIAIKGTERFDINVHSTGDSSNPGAIVALKTPAA